MLREFLSTHQNARTSSRTKISSREASRRRCFVDGSIASHAWNSPRRYISRISCICFGVVGGRCVRSLRSMIDRWFGKETEQRSTRRK